PIRRRSRRPPRRRCRPTSISATAPSKSTGPVQAGAVRGTPSAFEIGEGTLRGGAARGEARREEIAACRGFPVEHFTSRENPGAGRQHAIIVEGGEFYPPRRRYGALDRARPDKRNGQGLDGGSERLGRHLRCSRKNLAHEARLDRVEPGAFSQAIGKAEFLRLAGKIGGK